MADIKIFCGWIPTVTGNLSFTIIGQGRTPKRAFKIARACENARFVVASQRRRTTDVPFGILGDLFNRAWKREGYTVYTLFGKSLPEEDFIYLRGPCIELTVKHFSNLEVKLRQLQDKKLSDNEFESEFETLAEKFSRVSDNPGCDISAIDLHRDGGIRISLADLNQQEAQGVASQVFFFLRDICHVHQHHAPTSDTILDVVPLDDDNIEWKRETLYAFYRWVIQQKRSKSASAYIDAKGVLSYALAFTRLHCETTEENNQLPKYMRDSVIESLDAGLARARYLDETKTSFSDRLFNRILPLLIFTIVFLSQFYVTPNVEDASPQQEAVINFASWINENILFVFIASVSTIVLANLSYISIYKVLSLKIWRGFFLDLFRVLLALPFLLVVGVLAVISLTLLVLLANEWLRLLHP